MFIDANSKQGDAQMKKYNVDESFPGYLLFNSKGECKGYAGGIMKTASAMKQTFEMYLNYTPKN